MVDAHVVLSRIQRIRECAEKLKAFALLEEDQFLHDTAATDGAERNVQIAIQAVIDIGSHIVADMEILLTREPPGQPFPESILR